MKSDIANPHSFPGIHTTPLISVIIPVYNVSAFLPEALESVQNQTYRNLEIILVDDGSTDGSGKICDTYTSDNRIRVIHQQNLGLSGARNTGLNAMTGDLLVFFDSDDKLHPEFISRMLLAKQQTGAEIVTCKSIHIKTDGSLFTDEEAVPFPSIKEGSYTRDDAFRALLDKSMRFVCWNRLYDASLWHGIRFPVGRYYEDVAITHEIFHRCRKIHVIDDVLYLHRIHPKSISSSASVKTRHDFFWALTQFEDFLLQHHPQILTEELHESLHRQKLTQLLLSYAGLYQRQNADSELRPEDLRKKIIEIGAKTNTSTLPHTKRISYWLICHNPALFGLIYRPFRMLKKIKK
jgi:glycosyltransferase involved in cell wall biosynthesis